MSITFNSNTVTVDIPEYTYAFSIPYTWSSYDNQCISCNSCCSPDTICKNSTIKRKCNLYTSDLINDSD